MKLYKTIISPLLVAMACIGLSTGVAFAQDDDDDDDDDVMEERTGVTLGAGLGIGHLECGGDYCEGVTEAAGLHLNIGFVLMPRMAVVADIWAMAHKEDRLTVGQGIATVGAKVWLLPRLWAHAGVGVARGAYNYDIEVTEFEDSTEWNPAAMAAVGFELVNRGNFALDLQLRAGAGFFNDADTRIYNMSAGVGVNWY